MMKAGQINASNGTWIGSDSMAQAIEEQMISQELVNTDDETEEATLQRRKTLIAFSQGIINHISVHADISLLTGDIADLTSGATEIPTTNITLEEKIG